MILGGSENKRLIMKLHHIWNTKDISLISGVYSDKVVVHWLKSNKKVTSIGHTVSYTHIRSHETESNIL